MSEGSDDESYSDSETPNTQPNTPVASGRKILLCPYQNCTKSFNRQARLTEHIRSHTNERPFKCPQQECDKAFLRDSHLKHHVKSAHTNERNYLCRWDDCGKKFATGTRLRRHEASHEAKEKYTCKGFDGCNESFRKHATLTRHVLSVHENKKPFQCMEPNFEIGGQCSSGFDTAEKLRSHQRAVHDPTRFMCIDCPTPDEGSISQVTFATYALLQCHIAEVHPPACPQCFLLCTSDKDVRRHLEMDHNIVDSEADKSHRSSFPCIYLNCTRSFTKKGNLNVHVKTVHEHRKEFVCGETDLTLVRQGPQNEAQIQTAELAESSEITGCGRHFTSKATLEEHVRTVHLGMNSKRQERNKKRKAERAANEEDEDAGSCGTIKKRRKPRKGKSAIAELTGSTNVAVAAEFDPESGTSNSFAGPAYQTEHTDSLYYDFDTDSLQYKEYQGDDQQLFLGNEHEEENFVKHGFDTRLSSLATSALVDPALLAS
jgi:general transcription factor IIIA